MKFAFFAKVYHFNVSIVKQKKKHRICVANIDISVEPLNEIGKASSQISSAVIVNEYVYEFAFVLCII